MNADQRELLTGIEARTAFQLNADTFCGVMEEDPLLLLDFVSSFLDPAMVFAEIVFHEKNQVVIMILEKNDLIFTLIQFESADNHYETHNMSKLC